MSLEINILVLAWTIGPAAVAFTILRPRLAQFVVGYLVSQAGFWFIEMLLLKLRLLAFPLREFPKATDMGFTMSYLLYPMLCGIYIVFEPRHSWLGRTAYFVLWLACFTLLHYELAIHTNLIDYTGFHWSLAALMFAFVMKMSSLSVRKFFRSGHSFEGELEKV